MTARSVASLSAAMSANVGGFTRGFGQAQRSVTSFVQTFNSVLKGAVIGGAGLALFNTVTGVAAAAEDAQATAARLGTSAAEFSSLSYAAQQSEVAVEQLSTAMMRLNRNAYESATGNKEAARAFADVGVSAKNNDGSLKDSAVLLRELADRFAALPTGMRKTALAQQIFGRSGAALIPLLNQGAAGIAELQAKAAELGIVFDAEAAAAGDAFGDSLNDIRAAGKGVLNQAILPLLPALTQIATGFVDSARSGDALALAGQGIAAALKSIVSAGILVKNTFEIIGDVIRAPFGALADMLEGAGVRAVAANFTDAWDNIKSDTADITKGLADLWADPAVTRAATEAGAMSGVAYSAAADAAAGGDLTGGGAGTGAVDEAIKALELEAKTFNRTRLAVELYKLELQGATLAQLSQAAGAIQTVEALKKQKDMAEDAKKVIEEIRTPTESFSLQLQKLEGLRQGGFLTAQQFARAASSAYTKARDELFAGIKENERERIGEFRQVDLRRIVIGGGTSRRQEVRAQQLDITNNLLRQVVSVLKLDKVAVTV